MREPPLSSQAAGSSVPAHVRVLPMTDTNGTKYDCYLPSAQAEEDTSSSVGGRQCLCCVLAPSCTLLGWRQR